MWLHLWYRARMAKRPRDVNQIAKLIVDIVTGQAEDTISPSKRRSPIGRKGGLVGGKVRSARMSPEERSTLASKAARARWSKRKDK
jgi:hypothetical protein